MKEKIILKIKDLEKEHNVKILWGFESKDSDYDVRCMHIGKKQDYVGLFNPPLQINFNDGFYDIENWDIKKFGELMIKSNPQIAEWLNSSVVYRNSRIKAELKKIFDEGCSLDYLKEHYLSMAKKNYKKYINIGEANSCKKYLYVLRAIACYEFIKSENKLAPLPYKEVIGFLPLNVQKFFVECVNKKINSEKTKTTPEKEVDEFIKNYIEKRIEKKIYGFSKTNELNDFIIKCIMN